MCNLEAACRILLSFVKILQDLPVSAHTSKYGDNICCKFGCCPVNVLLSAATKADKTTMQTIQPYIREAAVLGSDIAFHNNCERGKKNLGNY